MALNPRWRKEWIPLFSQQLRLRNLSQVVAYNVRGSPVSSGRPLFYYTLHLTSKSAPFYSSEQCSGPNPRWAEIDLQRKGIILSGTGLVVRIWQCGTPDQLVVVWGLHLSGLVPVPPQTDLSKELGINALVLHLHGCQFISPTSSKPSSRLAQSEVLHTEARKSYSVPSLLRLHHVQLDTAEQAVVSESLKQSIQLLGPFPPPTQSLGCPGRGYKAQQLLSAREEARHRLRLLRGERARRAAAVATLKVQAERLEEEIQDTSNNLTGYYRSLSREVEHLKESKLTVVQTREVLVHTTSQLANRRRQLISQMKLIYPITEDGQGNVKICDVSLLSSEALATQDESSSSVALGFAAHATAMVAAFLDVPIRYPIIAAGSRARVWDLVAPKLPDSEREFPLFSRGRDKIQFNYAVYLLNKDIAQLRWYCGLPTRDLRATLLNLRDLLNMRTNPMLQHKRSLSGSSLELSVARPGGPQSMIRPPASEPRVPSPQLLQSQPEKTQASTSPIVSHKDSKSTDKTQKSSGSLESWDFLEPPIPKERYLEKEPMLSCSLDQGLDTLKQPRLNQTSGLLSSSKTANCSEPSLACRDKSDKTGQETDEELTSPEMTSSDVDSSILVSSTIEALKLEDKDDTVFVPKENASTQANGNAEPKIQYKMLPKSVETISTSNSKLRTLSEPCSSVTIQEGVEEFHDCLSKPNIEPSNREIQSVNLSDNEKLVQNVKGKIENTNLEVNEPDNVLKKFNSIDSLFANVASRTEALASKSGSFNLVKSRASTMETS